MSQAPVPVDWSKEEGYMTLSLEDGTEVADVMDYGGRKVPTFENSFIKRVDEIKHDFQSLEGDILIYGYMKSGTHWLWEIIRMVIGNDTNVCERSSKMDTFLESVSLDQLSKCPTPRILSSHLMPDSLPESILKNSKVVVPIRHPKDVAVSMFHHLEAEKNGTNLRCGWENFIKHVWFNPDRALYATWANFTSAAWKLCSENENYCPVVYEQLLESPTDIIRDLANFLGNELSQERLDVICQATKFNNMKLKKRASEKALESTFFPGYTMFRKGTKGDWKNHFTEDLNNFFDSHMKDIMAEDDNIRQVMLFYND